jgi:hypothetical protein
MESGFEHVRGARGIDSLFGWSQLLVTGVGWIFAGIFTYLQLQKYSFLTVVQSIQGQTLIHIALLLYYYAWILAQPLEVQMSRAVYISDPDRGKIPASLFSLIPILLILGAVLFIVQENERYLSAAFTAFFIIDVVFWLNIVRLARRYEAASARIYEKDGLDAQLAQLRCYVRSYLRGTWQYFRYATLAFILLLFNILVHVDSVRQFISAKVHNLVPEISGEKALDLIPGALFLTYILVGEGWVWTMRFRTRRTILIIDELDTQYKISRRNRRQMT